MILYTAVPIEKVTEGIQELEDNLKEVTINGILMQVQPTGENQAKIVRVISANPNDYMDPSYAPGQMVTYTAGINQNQRV